jgi:AcrR family transcriptional regulator
MAHISSSLPPSRSRDARVERTHKALQGALLRLLEEQSFDQITVRDISARAGTGYATFFRHYTDKAALLSDLATVSISELLERTVPVLYAVDTLAACLTLCTYVDERRQLWLTLLTGGAAGTLREEFVRQGRLLALHNQPSKDMGSWLPPDLAVVFGVSGVIELLAWWLEHPAEFTREEIAAVLNRLVIAPILQTEPLAAQPGAKPKSAKAKPQTPRRKR